MNSAILPNYIQPLELAIQGVSLSGKLSSGAMTRLKETFAEQQADVLIDFQFGKDEEGYAFLQGNIKASLILPCQRCLRAMELAIDIPLNLGLVTNEAAAKLLPERYEPLLVTAEPMLLSAIVEDELLLQLPMVAKHPAEKCTIDLQKFSKTGNNDIPKRANPFQALAKLKTKK